MAKYSRIDVILRMRESAIVPVFYHKDPDVCRNVIKACYDGGVRVFEFTNRGDFAHELFGDLSKWAEREVPGIILGTGTVVDASTASLYIQLGSNFIVSPVLNPDMAKVCNRRKILWIPGCATISEISHAEELGAEIVKLFPGNSAGGPDFVKSVKGPCPWTSIMPTGGVDISEQSLKAWFEAGVTCVGIGSNLISKDEIQNKAWKELSAKVKEAITLARKYQK